MIFDTFLLFLINRPLLDVLKAVQQKYDQLLVLNWLTDIFAVGKFDYGAMVRYQNLTRKPELFRAP